MAKGVLSEGLTILVTSVLALDCVAADRAIVGAARQHEGSLGWLQRDDSAFFARVARRACCRGGYRPGATDGGGIDFGPLQFAVEDLSLPPGFDGFIGYNFFAHHVVCMDFPGNRLLIRD
jgi:hypothetical protein